MVGYAFNTRKYRLLYYDYIASNANRHGKVLINMLKAYLDMVNILGVRYITSCTYLSIKVIINGIYIYIYHDFIVC
jgi:hypothetical protein